MSKVITFSRQFQKGHPREGEPTYFVEKIWKSLVDQAGEMNNPIGHFQDVHDEHFHPMGEGITNVHQYAPKHHTIRAGSRFKVGDKFSPRVWNNDVNPKSGRSGPYHSQQLIIAPDIEIKKIWNFNIDPFGGEYRMDGYEIPTDKLKLIALNDGFMELDDFELWFNVKPGVGFIGQIICWNKDIEY